MEKSKEPIRLRKRKLASGNISLYLDIYIDGRRSYEWLNLYLVPEKTRADKEKNKETLKLADAVRGKRVIELHDGRWKTQAQMPPEAKVCLTPYFFSVDPLRSFGRRGHFYFGLLTFCSLDFTHTLTGQFDTVGRMDYPVEYGVSHSWISDSLIPVCNRQLGGYDYELASVAVLDDFHQMRPLLGIERNQGQIIEYEQLGFLQFFEFGVDDAFVLGDFQRTHQFGRIGIEDFHACLACLVSKGSRQIALAGSAATGYEEVVSLSDELKGSQTFHLVAVESAWKGIVDLRHRCVIVPEAGTSHEPLDVAGHTVVPFAGQKPV